MNFTIEQKELITKLLAKIKLEIHNGRKSATGMPLYGLSAIGFVEDIIKSFDSAAKSVDKLKQYLMEIDNGTTK